MTDLKTNPRRAPMYVQKLNDKDAKVRRKAAIKLGQLRDPVGVEPLCHALRDTDAYVRKDAAASLGKLAAYDAFGALEAALKSRQTGLRHAAALSLAQIAATHPTLAGQAVNAIVQAVRNSNMVYRPQNVTALATIGLAGVGPLCVEYNTRRDGAAQWCIRQTLIQLEQQMRLDVRRQLLGDMSLPPPQQLAVVEMLMQASPKGWLAARQSLDARRYCEQIVADLGEQPDVRRGAQGVLDYLSLGRASQRYEPGEASTLLRMAGGENVLPDQSDTLLRGSEAVNAPDSSRPTLLAKLRRWIGLPPLS